MHSALTQQLADSLNEQAREHKRQEKAHRLAAQRTRRQLAELLAAAEAAGITVTVEAKEHGRGTDTRTLNGH